MEPRAQKEESVALENTHTIISKSIQVVKAALSDELTKIHTTNCLIEKDMGKAEQLNCSLILRQKEVEIMKNNLEKTLQESETYKEEMQAAVTQIKQEIIDIKEKQKLTVSHCHEKRQDLMRYLDECRSDSMKKSNQTEAEIDVERKSNANLKEKLNEIHKEKVSAKRNSTEQIKILENKIKKLEEDLDSIVIKPSEWRKSHIPPNKPPSIEMPIPNEVYMKPPLFKRFSSNKPKMRKQFAESDSDQSSIDFNDYINRVRTDVRPDSDGASKKRKKIFYSLHPPMMEYKEKMQDTYTNRSHYIPPKKHVSTKSKRKKEFEPLDLLSTL
ncbi:hypothetical protein L9F63_006577 [Diploptera punctata]|uniref:Uncharacterized protein n=1 Tax=Diploptera punctata TaxID=6984 RepID=A0AAD7ZB68_DIPPU|nr:hypothetical protein L9F63_006577 [Diploptera punctata]